MSFGFLNLIVLFGLVAVLIPVLIHLLNRRRYDVVDWGAMQFLQVSQTTRRRLFLEELLLMTLRMGAIALLVAALAAPYAAGPLLAGLGGRANRDVVLIFDGSYSMGRDDGKHKTPHEAAKEWAAAFLDDLVPGDSVAILLAAQQVIPLLEEPTQDLDRVRDRIAQLPEPHGGCDWPRAVREAHRILTRSKRVGREIIALSDGQRFGWADSSSLFHWDRLAAQLRSEFPNEDQDEETVGRPRVWVVHVSPRHDADTPVPNYALRPLRPARGLAWVGQRLTFRTALAVTGQQHYEPPYRIRLEVDGKQAGDLQAPATAALQNGQVPFAFTHRFTAPGSHLVSVILEPDPPLKTRTPGAALKDELPGDNRQDLAVDVIESLPVLLVDGDSKLTPESSTYFLRKALAQSPDPQRPPVVLTHTVKAADFEAALLTRPVDPAQPGSRPRVLVLADVPVLTAAQQRAVEQFLEDGGGVLVVLGERVEGREEVYNQELHREGQGWLPARLDRVAGDRARPDQAAAPDLKQFHHPALDLFRDEPSCTLGGARFPRWWKVTATGQGAAPVALLTTADPMFVEQTYKRGRVLLSTVPLDRSWGSNLPAVWEYPILVHELVYYLADTRSADHNLQPGQPLRYQPGAAARGAGDKAGLPATVVLHAPDAKPKPLTIQHWPLVLEDTRATGVYRLDGADGKAYYVVQPDQQESNLTPCSEEDRRKVAALLPVRYEDERQGVAEALTGAAQAQDLWWLAMVGVILLLCGEVWMTRRIVGAGEGEAPAELGTRLGSAGASPSQHTS